MRLRSWLAVAGVLTVGISGAMGVVALNASAATNTIEDTSSAVSWSGTWGQCSSNCNLASDNSFRWTNTANAAVTVSFSGNRIALWGNKERHANIGTVSIDGGAAVDVDFYADPPSSASVQVYNSPVLTEGNHTLKLTFTTRKNPGSTSGSAITFDKAVVTSGGTTNPSPSASSSSKPPSASPSTSTPPTGARLSGLPWNSGVNPQGQTFARVQQFESFRGARVDNITLFPLRNTWSTLTSSSWPTDGAGPTCANGQTANCFDPVKQDLIATIPLWPEFDGKSAANTGSQAQWQALANLIKGKDPNAYVRLGWEMNLPGSYWNLNSGNRTDWQRSFRDAVTWMKQVAPGLRFVWNPNKGADQTSGCNAANPCSRQVFQAVKDLVDVYGIDSYDSWPADTNADARRTHLETYLGEGLTYAKANGKKFAVPEWGVACNIPNSDPNKNCQWAGNAGGDNPQYITDYLGFFKANAADMAFDSYFDEPGAYIRSALSVTPIGPNAPAKYKQLIAQYKS